MQIGSPLDADLLRDYQMPRGHYDEHGPAWKPLWEHIRSLGMPDFERRWREVRRLIQLHATTYNAFGAPHRFELDPLPLLLQADESTLPWEEVVAKLPLERSPEGLRAYSYVFDSPLVPTNDAFRELGSEFFPAGRPVLQGALELTQWIKRSLRYDPDCTDVDTPVARVLELKAGVCQDFAHLQLAALRSLGLAARYVSGYLLTTPPEGCAPLVGVDGSHAWVGVYCPPVGWVDLDPTNGVPCGDSHITQAWGRDYQDVSPVKGVVLGGGKQWVSVGVDITPIPAGP